VSDTSAQEIAIRRRLRDDLTAYAIKALKIKAKDGGIHPFKFNKAQLHLHHEIEKQRSETGKVRAIGLKGRQQGFSTYCEGRFYWRVTHQRGASAYILTHEQPATDNLFAMADRFHEHCHPLLKPQTGTANAKELHFDKLDSGYRVGTAGSRAVGRSSTIHFFHGSELAFWPNAAEHFAGVLQAVPSAPGTEIILESTANGVGGTFHDLWTAATRGETEYKAIFVPWFWQPEYRRTDPGFVPTDVEKDLAKTHGLDLAQLAWRRNKIAELRSSDLFKQEYPCTPEEAFLYSGRPVFERDWLAKAKRETCNPIARRRLVGEKWTDAEAGELRVWAEPKPDTRYVIGADVAEGLEHGDYSCADVLECPGGLQVAQWHGHIAPDLFGDLIAKLGRHYNTAFVGVERNNHGLTTLTKLRDGGYPQLYAQADLEYRGSADKETKRLGWLTTQKSKFKIIDTLAGELRDGDHGLLCRETLDELYSFVIAEDGSYGAQVGQYDDRVMSRAIAGEMLYAQGYGRHRERHPKEDKAA
jgi:hypothetical protein